MTRNPRAEDVLSSAFFLFFYFCFALCACYRSRLYPGCTRSISMYVEGRWRQTRAVLLYVRLSFVHGWRARRRRVG